ncbi:Urocanate reductase [anaerobic digester metagenome]
MKKSKVLLSILLCFVMVFGLVACQSGQKGGDGAEALYKAGTYTSTAKGNNGDVKVEVEFSDTKIVSVKVVDHSETKGLSDTPIQRIPQEIVYGQTLSVDTVSGATYTSNAILTAVEDCVKQAGGDVEALKAKSDDSGEKTTTELSTDVVVVGAGGTGLTAAASAYENGADVIVLEKLAVTGGSTGLSGGGISATDTKFQREAGIQDSKESWMALWKERQSTSNPDSIYPDYEAVDKFMDEAVVTTEWLADYVGHKYGSIEGFGVDPVKRLHFPAEIDGKKGGAALIQSIENFVRKNNIEIMTETKATKLITNDNGDIVGVEAEGKDGNYKITAKKVILAAGGFAKNEELLERFVPDAKGTAELSAATAGSTGDGILMAEEVGAALYEDNWIIGLASSTKVPGTEGLSWDWTKVYVNENGERFTNEDTHYAIVTNKILAQESAWMILDSSDANSKTIEAIEAAMPTEEAVKGENIEQLSVSMGVPTENLVEALSKYNTGAKSGVDEFGKNANFMSAVEKGPFYALKLYPKTMGTFGGVKTNENYQVLREDGTVINNLYAGGECANKLMYNQVYMSGSAVQFALTSGRIAGAHASQNIK